MVAEKRQTQTVRLSHARKSMILLEAGEIVTAAACKNSRHEVCWIPVANFSVHETSDNIVIWLRQKIMERIGRGGTQGAGGAGGGASSYDQALKSLNEQSLQMRFTTQGKPPHYSCTLLFVGWKILSRLSIYRLCRS
jgi:hypothetical protein